MSKPALGHAIPWYHFAYQSYESMKLPHLTVSSYEVHDVHELEVHEVSTRLLDISTGHVTFMLAQFSVIDFVAWAIRYHGSMVSGHV